MYEQMSAYEIANHSGGPQWFAVWTRSRQEKSTAAILAALGVEHFLPLRSEIRQWTDRKQVVKVPLFTGYLFVRITLSKESRMEVLNATGIAGMVGNLKGPAPIPDQQIEDIHTILDSRAQCEVAPLLQEGDRVRVLRGALAGIEGRLIRRNSSTRLSISIDMINKSLIVNVLRNEVELIERAA
jgi:transcription termination/antitermination protein NusG